ncbi:hypothetical protein GQ457_06G018540 [Hibiscus cannabinus]
MKEEELDGVMTSVSQTFMWEPLIGEICIKGTVRAERRRQEELKNSSHQLLVSGDTNIAIDTIFQEEGGTSNMAVVDGKKKKQRRKVVEVHEGGDDENGAFSIDPKEVLPPTSIEIIKAAASTQIIKVAAVSQSIIETLEVFFQLYGIRPYTTTAIAVLGFTVNTLLNMKEEELDVVIPSVSQTFMWEPLIGEIYDIKGTVRVERRRQEELKNSSHQLLDSGDTNIAIDTIFQGEGGTSNMAVVDVKKKKRQRKVVEVHEGGDDENGGTSGEKQREHPLIITEPGEVVPDKKNGINYLFNLYEQCRGPYTTTAIAVLGFTVNTLLNMKEEQLDGVMTSVSQTFMWESLIGEIYGIKGTVRAERKRLKELKNSSHQLLVSSDTNIAIDTIFQGEGGTSNMAVVDKKKKKRRWKVVEVHEGGDDEKGGTSGEKQREHPLIITEPGEGFKFVFSLNPGMF